MPKSTDPLSFTVDTYRGEVILVCGRPISWASMLPGQARDLAQALNNAAAESEKEAQSAAK